MDKSTSKVIREMIMTVVMGATWYYFGIQAAILYGVWVVAKNTME